MSFLIKRKDNWHKIKSKSYQIKNSKLICFSGLFLHKKKLLFKTIPSTCRKYFDPGRTLKRFRWKMKTNPDHALDKFKCILIVHDFSSYFHQIHECVLSLYTEISFIQFVFLILFRMREFLNGNDTSCLGKFTFVAHFLTANPTKWFYV